jgi:CRISPR-associated endonuclease/helicase Cas3
VIQAAGRCNREGKQDQGRVVVFEPEGGGLPPGTYTVGAGVTRGLQAAAALSGGTLDPHDLQVQRTYFKRFLSTIGERGLDRDEIQELRKTLSYADVAAKFKMIDDDTYSVVITQYGSAENVQDVQRWLDDLRNGSAQARELRRRLQPYIVAVRRREALRLVAQSLIDEVRPGYGIWLGGYDAVRGFTGADPGVLIS